MDYKKVFYRKIPVLVVTVLVLIGVSLFVFLSRYISPLCN